jgi:hypothetical protein
MGKRYGKRRDKQDTNDKRQNGRYGRHNDIRMLSEKLVKDLVDERFSGNIVSVYFTGKFKRFEHEDNILNQHKNTSDKRNLFDQFIRVGFSILYHSLKFTVTFSDFKRIFVLILNQYSLKQRAFGKSAALFFSSSPAHLISKQIESNQIIKNKG